MRSSILFIAFVLAVSSVAATNTALYSKLDRIAGSKFGRAILETIDLEIGTSADPRPKIIQLLEELRTQTIEAQKTADSDHGIQQGLFASSLNDITTAISKLEETIRNDSDEKLLKENDLNTAKNTKNTHEQVRDNAKFDLETAETSRKNNQALYEEKDIKFDKILAALQQVRTWLQDRRNNRYSFLQKSENVFPGLAQIKSEEFMKVSPGYGKLLAFLATKVEKSLQPTSQDATAESGLDNIIRIIDNLIAQFQGEKRLNFEWNEGDIKSYGETKTRLEGIIAEEQTQISNLEIEITRLEGRIGELDRAITANNGNLDNKKEEKRLTEESRDAEQTAYETATSNRTNELAIIEEVLDIVRNQLTGLREYTENRIVNSDIDVNA